MAKHRHYCHQPSSLSIPFFEQSHYTELKIGPCKETHKKKELPFLPQRISQAAVTTFSDPEWGMQADEYKYTIEVKEM